MSEAIESAPAFPGTAKRNISSDPLAAPREVQFLGLTMRDWFAGQALLGIGQEYLHRNGFHGDTMPADLAVHAYRVADAMLVTRKEGGGA